MDTPPPAKRPREMSTSEPASGSTGAVEAAGAEDQLHFSARKSSPNSTPIDVSLAGTATVGDLAAHLAALEGCDRAAITLVCKGKVLADATVALRPLIPDDGPKTMMVYIVRGAAKAAAAAAPAAKAAETPATAAAPAPAAVAAPAAASTAAAPASTPSSVPVSAPAASSAASGFGGVGGAVSQAETAGHRVLLLLRHGQCMHKDEHDEMKALTGSGHQQAEESAKYVAALFSAGRLPQQRALLHSTSRRARETAAKLPQHLPGIAVWNADLLRETDPTANPLRAEEVFQRLFAAPAAGAADTLIVVAHNNIILYWLMRAAGVPVERASQAWNLFQLRHASVTRVDVAVSGARRIVSVGAAAHIPHTHVTWNNITGADMAAWKGGGAERKKFSGRMLILVRQLEPSATRKAVQIEATAAHIKGLTDYMVSGHLTVACTGAAKDTALPIAQQFKARPQVLTDAAKTEPEAVFLQYFCPSQERSRDTVVLVTEHNLLLYWLLRSLHMSPEEATVAIESYSICQASITLLNIRSDGSMKAVGVGDTGHLPMDCLDA